MKKWLGNEEWKKKVREWGMKKRLGNEEWKKVREWGMKKRAKEWGMKIVSKKCLHTRLDQKGIQMVQFEHFYDHLKIVIQNLIFSKKVTEWGMKKKLRNEEWKKG